MLEIAIIGAGPAGLSAGINAIARGKTVRIFFFGKQLSFTGRKSKQLSWPV
ncbi:MAG: FAD-binding protein [[Clostridium] leptum]